MGKYVLKIGTSEFNKEIQGTEDWTQTLVRNFQDKIYRTKGDYKFTGWQGLYSVLYSNLVTNGVCQSLDGNIFFRGSKAEAFSEIWRGKLKPQDFEFDLINYSSDGQILDQFWSSTINNTQGQRVFIRTDKSINDVSILSCPYYDCDFFNPTDISYYGDTRRCFKVFDVFEFLVNYYTDGTVAFASDYFSSGGDGEQYYITKGKELRLFQGGVNPEVSFSDFFSEMQKKFNLWIIIESDDFDNPVLRIEPHSYMFQEIPSITIENPEKLLVRTDLEQLYTVINNGSDETSYDLDNDASYPNSFYFAWNEESYNSTGDCQFESNVLDLKSTYKIDSNSIEKSLKGDDTYDDDIFIIEIDNSQNAFIYTDQYTLDNSDLDGFYNYNLTNAEVINNWFDSIPSLIKALMIGYNCEVNNFSTIGDSGSFQVINYATEVSDFYDIYLASPPFDSVFTAPVTGYYTFQGQMVTANINDSNAIVGHRVRVWRDNTLLGPGVPNSVYVAEYRGPSQTGATGYNLTINQEIYLEAGWVARSEFWSDTTLSNFDINSASMVVTGPLLDIGQSNDDPLVFEYEIDQFALSVEDYNTIKASRGFVRFLDTKTGRSYNVWPTEMTYSHEKQIVTSGKFIGRNPLNSDVDLCWVLEGGVWNDDCYWLDNRSWID